MSTKKPAAIRRLEGNPGKRVIEECGIDARASHSSQNISRPMLAAVLR
jgi:hypothetical protein